MLQDLQNFLTPEYIIQFGGLTLFFCIIFIESGTLVGIFMPGESLLFVAGLSCRLSLWNHSLFIILIIAFSAAMLGTFFGYYTGAKSRYSLIKKQDSTWFKRRHFARVKVFFRKYRRLSLLIGRFFPVLRSLLPIFAGIVRMHFGYFTLYSLTGVFVWSIGFILLGYWCGDVFPEIKAYMSYSLIGLAIISIVPLVKKILPEKKGKVVEIEDDIECE
jgi:membrane-associated protein